MKNIFNHPKYGQIIVTESFWTGKKNVIINGRSLQKNDKNSFMFKDEEETVLVFIEGNIMKGTTLFVNKEQYIITPKPKWYEYVLAIMIAPFIIAWGNSVPLCRIFPIVGGAIGGGIGGAFLVLSFYLMLKVRKPIYKVLIGLGMFALAVFVAHIVALIILSMMV